MSALRPAPRWEAPSPPVSPSSYAATEDEDDALHSAVRSIQLNSSSPRAPERDRKPTHKILTDLSESDFDKQAEANSRAASLAMTRNQWGFRTTMAPPVPPRSISIDLRTTTSARPPITPGPPEWTGSIRTQTTTAARTAKPAFEEEWFAAPPNETLNDPNPDAWRYRDPIPRGWNQPVFRPGRRFQEIEARERLLPPALGGRSKKDQLGSVNASWGPLGEQGTKVYGMFEIEQDPPSRSTSPFKEEADEEERQRPGRHEVREARGEAMERAREGTNYASAQLGYKGGSGNGGGSGVGPYYWSDRDADVDGRHPYRRPGHHDSDEPQHCPVAIHSESRPLSHLGIWQPVHTVQSRRQRQPHHGYAHVQGIDDFA
ncbi:uncharacterized protein MKK02DRAFT_44884 [Dioszegia hungarica]|uniref:Uncharacterized protein n=1 Tax=Dioszegia hungarica TaxID=4972 RepID=A0AA38LW62_9TREE|nr:uncharacterized protein MKK02DRAFT_44884 [Dioszegia hungarica]KAI9636181.1 hypothetical protein MKK02DRAFT_44884 [Dioszegia hungarica]